MTNNKLKVAAYVAEIESNETLCETLKELNKSRRQIIDECNDPDVVAAREELDTARARYNKLATAYVLKDAGYCNLQTECVRAAVSEYSRTHKVRRFFQWLDDNGKDEQKTIIDSVQRLGSKVAALHATFASGAKVAKEVVQTEEERQRKIADLKAQLKALQADE